MKYEGMSILIAVPDFPYPANHGGRVDIWNRLLCLKKMGFVIDLLVAAKAVDMDDFVTTRPKGVIRETFFVERNLGLASVLRALPYQVKSRYGLAKINIGRSYDFLLLESQYTWHVLYNTSIEIKYPPILRIHNDECTYHMELGLSSRSLWKKAFFLLEALKFKKLDGKVFREITNYMFISSSEHDAFKRRHLGIHSRFIPSAIDVGTLKKFRLSGSRRVLFVGSLFMGNNQEAVKWFIRNVHPALLKSVPGYSLVVAGNTRGESVSREFARAAGVEFIESPSETTLGHLYKECTVFVNPMLHGAGVKLKTVEAIRNALPVVSTSIGNQGTGLQPGREIFVADDPARFSSYVASLLLDDSKRQELVENGQRFLRENYNQEKALREFINEVVEGERKASEYTQGEPGSQLRVGGS